MAALVLVAAAQGAIDTFLLVSEQVTITSVWAAVVAVLMDSFKLMLEVMVAIAHFMVTLRLAAVVAAQPKIGMEAI